MLNFKLWIENEDHELNWAGAYFKTGTPVEFKYMRNTKSAPNFASTNHDPYQQNVEPHGRYMIQHPGNEFELQKGWESGVASFKNPLVIPLNTVHGNVYDENSWKIYVSKKFGGKTGLKLSKAIRKAGYDGIITLGIGPDGQPYDTREIVDLRGIDA